AQTMPHLPSLFSRRDSVVDARLFVIRGASLIASNDADCSAAAAPAGPNPQWDAAAAAPAK
ncbi:hypothetical protein MNEG_16663, partial [Monoraphidium neglectum]